MSIKVMGEVWELVLPAAERMVLLALADHADHTGRNAYPGADLLAWKTGYSERQVQRILDSLEMKRLAQPQGNVKGGRGKATNYRVCPENGIRKEPFSRTQKPAKSRRKKGVNLSLFDEERVTSCPLKGDILSEERVTFCPLKGDILTPPHIESAHVEPSLNRPSEPSIEKKQLQQAAVVDDFAAEIQSILLRLGVKASADLVNTLTAEFGRAAVQNQAHWLSRRSAQTLRLFCAAVRKGYEEPPAEANSIVSRPAPAGVTRVGKGNLKKRELMAEICLHGRAVVLQEMVAYHEFCRRSDKSDRLLSAQCRMIEFLTTATDEQVVLELTEAA